jgi:hypothetical protein
LLTLPGDPGGDNTAVNPVRDEPGDPGGDTLVGNPDREELLGRKWDMIAKLLLKLYDATKPWRTTICDFAKSAFTTR